MKELIKNDPLTKRFRTRERRKEWYKARSKDPEWLALEREKARLRKQKWRKKNPQRNKEIDRKSSAKYAAKYRSRVNWNSIKCYWKRKVRFLINPDGIGTKMRSHKWKHLKEGKKKMEEEKNIVNHPGHYAEKGKVECIEFIEAMVTPYTGVVAGDIQNVLKYTWRYEKKNGKEDLEKAAWYMNHAKETIEKAMKDPRKNRDMVNFAEEHGNWTGPQQKLISKAMKERSLVMSKDEAIAFAVIIKSIANGNAVKHPDLFETGKAVLSKWVEKYDQLHKKKDPITVKKVRQFRNLEKAEAMGTQEKQGQKTENLSPLVQSARSKRNAGRER